MWLINNENRHNIELPPLMGMSHDIQKMVREERLELSHLAALEPKSSVSTNSTTLANI